MSGARRAGSGFEDRLAEAIAITLTTARIAAIEMETAVEPAMPQTDRELSRKLRVEIESDWIVSKDFHARLRKLLGAIDEAIDGETTEVPVPLEGLLFAPGKEGANLTERRLSSKGKRLQAARTALAKLESCIVVALDNLGAARAARRLIET